MKGIAFFFILIITSSYSYSREVSPLIIRLGYGLNEQSHQGHAVRFFAEEVAKRSKGQMLVRSIGDAALGPDIQMQQALIRGTQEMMVGSTATLVDISQQMALWDTPFLFANTAEADAILDGPVGQQVLDSLKSEGLVGLVYWENGFRNLTNAKHPVRTLEDFDGLKLRVMQNDIYLQTFQLLGVEAVPLPFSELFFALESNLVDGQENPFSTILSSEFFELQQYLSVTNHVYSPWVMLASKSWWDQLSDDQRDILMDAANASSVFQRNHARSEADKAVAALKNKGMQINEFPATEHVRLQERLCQVHTLIASRVGESIWLETQSQLATLRQPRSLFRFLPTASTKNNNAETQGISPCP